MSEDRRERGVPVRTALLMSAAGGVAVAVVLGGGMLVARAVPWGPSVDALAFAGTLKLAGGPVASQTATLDFTLKKGGAAACALPGVTVMTDAQGAFTARLDLSKCPSPRGLFDGVDVKYGIVIATVNGQPVGQAMTPDGEVTAVPYAKYDSPVKTLRCASDQCR